MILSNRFDVVFLNFEKKKKKKKKSKVAKRDQDVFVLSLICMCFISILFVRKIPVWNVITDLLCLLLSQTIMRGPKRDLIFKIIILSLISMGLSLK